MNNNTSYNYGHHWNKSRVEPDRVQHQLRAVNCFKRLFNDLLHIKFEGSIVDLGCGDGSLITAINLDNKAKATGTDISMGVDFENEKLSYEDNQFDIAIMYSVLEHLWDPGNLLNEVKRIVKKNGHLILVLPNYITAKENFYDDPTHIHPYTPTSLSHLMEIYKFDKLFLGLWTVGKSSFFWTLPEKWQFRIGNWLPFNSSVSFVPGFLKGKSKTMFGVFKNQKD